MVCGETVGSVSPVGGCLVLLWVDVVRSGGHAVSTAKAIVENIGGRRGMCALSLVRGYVCYELC